MMRGLHKSTGYWQTQAARGDWTAMAKFAGDNGLKSEAEKRRIDKQIVKLREVLQNANLEFVLPSAKS
jgi:hypothetical protein